LYESLLVMSRNKVAGEAAEPRSADRGRVVLVAIIGVVAALLGAGLGGVFTYFVTVHSEDTKRTEDRRVERRDAYAQFYGDAMALADQVTVQMPQVIKAKSGNPIDHATLDRIQVDFNEKRRQLSHDQGLIVLLGSKKLADAGFELVSKVEEMKNVVLKDKPTDEEIKESALNMTNALDDFATAAKGDLGIP
jgi:hypothetical protein